MRYLFILTIGLGFILSSCGKKQEELPESEERIVKMATDPVCKMQVDEFYAPHLVEHAGETYYFCNKADKEAFIKNPDKYLSESVEDPLD